MSYLSRINGRSRGGGGAGQIDLHQIEEMKNRDVIVSILNTSIKVIFAVMALLVAMHPAVYHVLAVLVPLEDSVEKWVENAVHAVSECQCPAHFYY